ncbi:palmitoyltransferase for Vac8p [Metarhizium acridum]|nr:palmitoyltransferase for Vac8p [Metarhizium acridum]
MGDLDGGRDGLSCTQGELVRNRIIYSRRRHIPAIKLVLHHGRLYRSRVDNQPRRLRPLADDDAEPPPSGDILHRQEQRRDSLLQKVPGAKAGPRTPLLHVPPVCTQDGPPLSVASDLPGSPELQGLLLFLIYTTILCVYAFAVSGTWVWSEIIEEDVEKLDALLPVNFIVLSVLSGIIGIVVGVFTGWHVMLALKGQTTIECLEKTRYLSPLKQPYRAAHNPANRLPQAAQQFVDFHTNALPGITRPEEGEERRPSNDFNYSPAAARRAPGPRDSPQPVQLSYEEHERLQSQRRYEEYLDEQDSTKLPSAFDLGWKKNLRHLLGPNPWLWAIPICNTTGDGWSWEASPKWLEARDRIKREREEQRAREISAGWGGHDDDTGYPSNPNQCTQTSAADRNAPRKLLGKADRVLGRDPNLYADGSQGMRMQRLSTRGRSLEDELLDTDNDEDEDEDAGSPKANSRDKAERRALDVVTNGKAWTRGGASGMLRKATHSGSAGGAGPLDDQGVD